MAIFDRNGQQVYLPWRNNGVNSKYAFTARGNVTYPYDICVMTYNVQWFQDFNAQEEMQSEIIGKYKPDILGLQELSQNGRMPSVGVNVLNDYYTILSNHKNYLGMASNRFILKEIESIDYVSQDPQDMELYGETRAYMKTFFDFNGVNVLWLNTHLSLTPQYKIEQFNELLAIVAQEKYFIITGDFNINGADKTSEEYQATFKVCENLGYNLANGSSKNGTLKTHTTNRVPVSEDDFNGAPDNIITSHNIQILARTVDFTKLRYLDGQNYVDHVPVVAFLKVCIEEQREEVLSLSNGALVKIEGSVDSNVNDSNFPNRIRWNDTNSGRGGIVVLSGVSPYKRDSDKQISGYYPISVPKWAKYIDVVSDPATEIYMTFIRYNENTGAYSSPIAQYTVAWGNTPITKEIANIDDSYIVLTANQRTVIPTDITIKFRSM